MLWKFNDAPDTAVISSADVIDLNADICLVTHDEDDGMWQFLSANGAPDELSEARVVGL